MINILKEICFKTRKEIEINKYNCSLNTLKKLLPQKKNRNFKKILIESQIIKKNNIIAEIKKSSPSAGEIVKNYKPEDIGVQYEKSGAGAISILTESSFFEGHVDHMSTINRKTNLPILRKDFIIDEYQIFESKVFKADAILLILSILSDEKIRKFIKIADDIGLDCIIETHDSDELERAIKINYPLIGINNRNLDNLSIDTNNTIKLRENISENFTIIGESGISKFSDIESYNKSGIYNFLIGEALLTSKNIDTKFKELLNK
jgi:indole-3-glycerol phosphate synthase